MSDPVVDADDTDPATPLTPNERRRLIPSRIALRRELNEAEQEGVSAVHARQAERTPARPPHTDWLQGSGERLTTVDRRVVEVWELRHIDDQAILSAWAAHFRNHYCSDADLPDFIAGTGKTAAEYLVSIKFLTLRLPRGQASEQATLPRYWSPIS